MPLAGDAGGMPVSPDHEPLLRLLHSGASASALRRLLDTHGDAAAAVAAGRRDWASHGVDATACAAVLRPEAAALADSLRWLEAPAHHLLGWADNPDMNMVLPGRPEPQVEGTCREESDLRIGVRARAAELKARRG